MAEATPQPANKPPSQRSWRRAKWLVLVLGACLLSWEAYAVSPLVRMGVVQVLGWFGPSAAPLLLGLCQDEDLEVGVAALTALAELGPATKPALERSLTHPSAKRREAAADLLERLGPSATSALPALIEVAAKDPNTNARASAIRALGSVGREDESAGRALLEFLEDADPQVRKPAVHSLGKLGAKVKGAVRALAARLKDGDAQVRREAAEALEQIGPEAREAIPALTAARKDPEPRVRKSAEEALTAIRRSPPPK